MTRFFEAARLRPEEARLAFPLIQCANYAISLPDWLQFVRRCARAHSTRSGIMSLRDTRGYIHAIFCFRVDRDFGNRKRLRITDLVMSHLAGEELRIALMSQADELAVSLGCASVVIDMPAGLSSAKLLAQFGGLTGPGYQPASVAFVRPEVA
jgi:hypothetical protein